CRMLTANSSGCSADVSFSLSVPKISKTSISAKKPYSTPQLSRLSSSNSIASSRVWAAPTQTKSPDSSTNTFHLLQFGVIIISMLSKNRATLPGPNHCIINGHCPCDMLSHHQRDGSCACRLWRKQCPCPQRREAFVDKAE